MIKVRVTLVPEQHCFKYDAGCQFCWLTSDGFKYSLTCEEVTCYPAKFSVEENEKEGYICKDHLERCQNDEEFEVEIVEPNLIPR